MVALDADWSRTPAHLQELWGWGQPLSCDIRIHQPAGYHSHCCMAARRMDKAGSNGDHMPHIRPFIHWLVAIGSREQRAISICSLSRDCYRLVRGDSHDCVRVGATKRRPTVCMGVLRSWLWTDDFCNNPADIRELRSSALHVFLCIEYHVAAHSVPSATQSCSFRMDMMTYERRKLPRNHCEGVSCNHRGVASMILT